MRLEGCAPGRTRCAARATGPKLVTQAGDKAGPASRHVSDTNLEKQSYAVPAVRTSRLERPDGAILELAADRVVSVPLARPDLHALRLRAAHRARDRAAAREALPDGPVRPVRRGA